MKFDHNEHINLFKKFDIIVIHKSHFAERTRCPNGFLLVCRSNMIESKDPRGGVAIFKNLRRLNLEVL